MPRSISLVALLLIAFGVAGCSVQLRTAAAPTDACDDAVTTGRLVTSAESGLAIDDPTGKVIEMIWPFGYSARRGMAGIELLDEKGATVAREGDFVEVAGGLDGNDVWNACAGGVNVVPAQG